MPRKPPRWNSLKKPKVRQDWSKENLYNLSRLALPRGERKTLFQQKWAAKAITRGYHNPYVREGAWTRKFDRRLPSVVPMDYRYLAKYDGSEQAAGRGSGLDQTDEAREEARPTPKTPYMHMTFHPLERRLDTAVWRALFASSAKQARQFVVHGAVKVNGKKMQYPGYLLNPGDLFSVDPEKVMYATGARKFDKDRHESIEDRQDEKDRGEDGEESKKVQEEGTELEDGTEANSKASGDTLEFAEGVEVTETPAEDEQDPKTALKSIMTRAQRILDDSKRELSGKRQQELRQFTRSVRSTLSKLRGIEDAEIPVTIDGLESGLAEILTKIPNDDLPKGEGKSATQLNPHSSNPQMQDPGKIEAYNARRHAELLHAALERARLNPIDSSKPYATPWKPRPYMSAFAFIPRYLEVNQSICSAVYLRHPVARPGLAEAPTPFNEETLGLVFNWYLRRR